MYRQPQVCLIKVIHHVGSQIREIATARVGTLEDTLTVIVQFMLVNGVSTDRSVWALATREMLDLRMGRVKVGKVGGPRKKTKG